MKGLTDSTRLLECAVKVITETYGENTAKKAVATVAAGWIPIDERIPAYGQKCLVSLEPGSYEYSTIETAFCYLQKEGFWTGIPQGYNVTAWMLLPEPFKGGLNA